MATKVLIVLDGDYRFVTGTPSLPDFTYVTLVDALNAAGMTVTKAHRQSDPDATLTGFDFSTHDLRQYDVIWLLGHEGRNAPPGSGSPSPMGLSDPQVAALARFMKAGGGVFATGDHDSIGCVMCGKIPRVRAMRAWYGAGDATSPMPAGFPRNNPVTSANRADTTQRNPGSDYGGDADLVWFENQSDSLPQPIAPETVPSHAILRRGGADITVYPDHMHEGKTLGEVTMMTESFDYDYTQTLNFDGTDFEEFPPIGVAREKPKVIASGQSLAHKSSFAKDSSSVIDPALATARKINTLSVYEGRNAGVGRIVTGSTFHHYVDINLTGDTNINSAGEIARATASAQKTHGFNDAPAVMADIKAAFVNITNWLARPRPAIGLILERSTFGETEAGAHPDFDDAILVTVDGLTPSQFPGGPIDSLAEADFDPAWAPVITPVNPAGIQIVPVRVDSDDPTLPARLQRFTFTYRVTLDAGAFAFAPDLFRHIRVDAELASPDFPISFKDSAWLTLVKAANPFMLDLDGTNTTAWLSSDFRIFPVVEGQSPFGPPLGPNPDRGAALGFLRDLIGAMTPTHFENLPHTQSGSALSPFAETTVSHKKVYNFAVARVRLDAAGADANDVRVFFRLVPSPTTALLTYHEAGGVPSGSYKKTAGADPIALPGTDGGNTEWFSFPVFSNTRAATPAAQTDGDNKKTVNAGVDAFFGALIDNNLDDTYLPSVPGPGTKLSLKELMMGEHQCIVAQIEYGPTPIPDGAKPATSDKLAQRNIAFSPIANPGVDGSRTALHTFEIEAAPGAVAPGLPPDELLLQWSGEVPDGTEVRLIIPGWDANAVIALADAFYPRHELRALDAETVAVPGGGTRYVPVPPSAQRRTGVIAADFPLGVKRGQRFDLAVRQITNRGREPNVPPPKVTKLSLAEAAALVPATHVAAAGAAPARGVFALGGNKTLVTDLSVFDAASDHALLLEHPKPAAVAAAMADSGRWRETVGAFQLAVPVTVKSEMLHHHLRLLSVMRWRADRLRPNDRWYAAFRRYVAMLADKVAALGGNPWTVPATPDGAIPLSGGDGGPDEGYGPDDSGPGYGPGGFWWRWWWLLLLIAFLLGLLIMWLLTR